MMFGGPAGLPKLAAVSGVQRKPPYINICYWLGLLGSAVSINLSAAAEVGLAFSPHIDRRVKSFKTNIRLDRISSWS
jgi:hypothetical protein